MPIFGPGDRGCGGKGLPTSWSVVTMLLAVGLEIFLWTSIRNSSLKKDNDQLLFCNHVVAGQLLACLSKPAAEGGGHKFC